MSRNLVSFAEARRLLGMSTAAPKPKCPAPAVVTMTPEELRLIQPEAEFQAAIERRLDFRHWAWFHDNPVTVCPNRDCRTPLPPRNNPGFPDLVATDGRTLLLVELKRLKGRVRPEQRRWAGLLETVETVVAGIYQPDRFNDLEEVILKGGW